MYKKYLFLLNILLLCGTACFSMMRNREMRDMGTRDQSLDFEPSPKRVCRHQNPNFILPPISLERQWSEALPRFSEQFPQYTFPNPDGLNEMTLDLDEEDEEEYEETTPLTRRFLHRELTKCMFSNNVLDLSQCIIGPLEAPLLDLLCRYISERPISGLKINFETTNILDSEYQFLTEKLNLILRVLSENQRRGFTLYTLEIQNFKKTEYFLKASRKKCVNNNILNFDTTILKNFLGLRELKIGLSKNMDPSFLEHLRQVERGEIVAPRHESRIQNAIYRFLKTSKIKTFIWHNCFIKSLKRPPKISGPEIKPSSLEKLVLINAFQLNVNQTNATFFGRKKESHWPCLREIYFDSCKCRKYRKSSIEKLASQDLQKAKNRGFFGNVRVFYKNATDTEFHEIISTNLPIP